MPYIWTTLAIATVIFLVDTIAGRFVSVALVLTVLMLAFLRQTARSIERDNRRRRRLRR